MYSVNRPRKCPSDRKKVAMYVSSVTIGQNSTHYRIHVVMGHRVLAALLALHAAALYLFTTGFFLTRFEVSDLSSCQASPSDTNSSPAHLRGGHEDLRGSDDAAIEGCWMPRRFRRVVFVVIDALRFDFAAAGSSAQRSTFYSDRLPILNDMLVSEPEHALLLKFVADPPTMTMQRLKGLTTGSLPTFLDIKDNMAASSQIVEDNLLRQRVDHVGHTHGPSSVFMAEKLDEMNGVLKKLLQELKEMPGGEDVLLAVLGDHGMSADGNHGGASDEETGAALFLYSKTSLVATGGGSDNEDSKELRKYAQKIFDNSREVPQVDLVPTLALLSGLPIPFGNLGSVIPSLFFVPPQSQTSAEGEESSAVAAFQSLNQALRLNLDQVRRYLFRYSSESKLPERAYDHLEKLFVDIKNVEKRLKEGHGGDTSSAYLKADIPLLLRLHEDLAKQQQNYLREALSLGRSIWTQFDLCSMGWGITLLTWSVIVGAASSRRTTSARSSLSESRRRLGIVAATGGLFFICPASVNLPWLPAAPLSRALVVASCTGLVELTWQLSIQRKIAAGSLNGGSRIGTPPLVTSISTVGAVAAVVVVLHALALLSNSYIVAEGSVMQFLSATTGFFLLGCAQRLGISRNPATIAALMFLCATRVSSALEPPNIIKASTTLWITFAPLAVTAILTVGSSLTLARLTGRPLSLMGKWILASSVVSYSVCAIFWAASPIEVTFWRLWLPRFVYLIFLGTLLCLFVRALRRTTSDVETFQPTSDHLLILWQLVPAFMLVLGPTSPLSVLCLMVQCLSFVFILTCRRADSSASFEDITPWILLWASCSYQAFFTTGHANTFTSLQNAAGTGITLAELEETSTSDLQKESTPCILGLLFSQRFGVDSVCRAAAKTPDGVGHLCPQVHLRRSGAAGHRISVAFTACAFFK
ncbi:hypothetical protein ON010_g2934 [Phytophthora cinnamomi]|nr:hypothetical protein ON010_g2934 [Phytophthora cinnamomi]